MCRHRQQGAIFSGDSGLGHGFVLDFVVAVGDARVFPSLLWGGARPGLSPLSPQGLFSWLHEAANGGVPCHCFLLLHPNM